MSPQFFNLSKGLRHAAWLMLVALSCISGTAWAQLSAGKVMAVSGTAKAIDSTGRERMLEKGAEVFSGDKLVTADGALVQMRLNDGGYMSVRSNTEMVLDRFHYDDKDASKSNFLVSLVRGGFRSITGLIGRTNPDAYQIRSATATVGIRGTDHEPMVIPDIPGIVSMGPPGLYDKVNDGETFIRNKGGLLALKRGDIGFSPITPDKAPQVLVKVPDFYKVDVKTDARDPKDAASNNKSDGSKQIGDSGGLLRPSTAARRESLGTSTGKGFDMASPVKGGVALRAGALNPTATAINPTLAERSISPTSTVLSPLKSDGLSPTTVDSTQLRLAPSTTLIEPTTTYIAPKILIAPTTTYIAPTTTLIAPTTTYIAPTTTYIAPTTTYIAPTTTISPTLSTTTTLIK